MIHLMLLLAVLVGYVVGTLAAIRWWGWGAGILTWLALTYLLRSYLLLATMAIAFLWMQKRDR